MTEENLIEEWKNNSKGEGLVQFAYNKGAQAVVDAFKNTNLHKYVKKIANDILLKED